MHRTGQSQSFFDKLAARFGGSHGEDTFTGGAGGAQPTGSFGQGGQGGQGGSYTMGGQGGAQP